MSKRKEAVFSSRIGNLSPGSIFPPKTLAQQQGAGHSSVYVAEKESSAFKAPTRTLITEQTGNIYTG
jgi:hypothetical protein